MRLRSLPFLCSVVSLTAQVPARLLANRTRGGALHLFRTGVCLYPSAFQTAQVPARLLANRTRGKPDICFGPAFVCITPRFQRGRFRPGFLPTEPVGLSLIHISEPTRPY